jgi:hypothetical protein
MDKFVNHGGTAGGVGNAYDDFKKNTSVTKEINSHDLNNNPIIGDN